MITEQWKPIHGFEGMYAVSDFGRVKSLTRNKTSAIHGIVRTRERIISPRIVGAGYLQVVLYHDGKRYTKYLHVLTACAFIPNPDGLKEVNHKNLRKHDCSVANLEWSSRRNNIRHAIEAGVFHKSVERMKGNLYALGIGGRRGGKSRSEGRAITRNAMQTTRPKKRYASTK